jgi:hypothetical protein
MNIRCPVKPYTYDISLIALPMDLTILWALLDFMNSLQKEEWTSGLGNSEKEGCVMPPICSTNEESKWEWRMPTCQFLNKEYA